MKLEANKEFMENLSLHSSHLKKFRCPRRRKLNYRYVRLLGRLYWNISVSWQLQFLWISFSCFVCELCKSEYLKAIYENITNSWKIPPYILEKYITNSFDFKKDIASKGPNHPLQCSGAPCVTKFGKLSIRENLVMTPESPPTRTHTSSKPMSNVTIDLAQLDSLRPQMW